MSYINAEKHKDNIIIWERDEDGKRITKTRKAPYYFYTNDLTGEYTSMYGDKLVRHDFDNSYDFYNKKKQLKNSGMKLFESDIPSEIKYLSEHYYNATPPDWNVTFLDIEVDYDPDIGHASVQDPYAPINAIALCNMWQKKYIVLAVPPNLAPRKSTNDDYVPGNAPDNFVKMMNDIAELPKDMKLEIIFCADERELLEKMLDEIDDSDVLCGWNSEMFDIPYIGRRLEKISKKHFRQLSFPEAKDPKFREVEKFKKVEHVLDLGGRISADYMVLFQKYEMTERPSYKLANIAAEVLDDLPKLEYDKSLAQQYREDFSWFVRYNIRDTEILQGFEDRLGYVDLANKMMHLSTATWKAVTGTLKLAEYSVVNYCHNELGGMIVNDMSPPQEVHKIQGAFVLIPQIGLHEYSAAIDLNSLYPSSIRAINMSPETLIGQFLETTKASEAIANNSDREITLEFDDATQVPEHLRGKTVTAKAEQWRGKFKQLGWAVSGYGTVFHQNTQGVIPKILEDWYTTRKKFQKKSKDASMKMKEILDKYK